MSPTTNVQAPIIISVIFGFHTLAIGAAIGFGVDVDNLQNTSILTFSVIAALFVAGGVFLAARLAPKYAYLWFFLITAPIPLGFRVGLLNSVVSFGQTILLSALPFTIGLLVSTYFRSKYNRDAKHI